MSVLHIRDPITNEFVPIAALQGELYDGSVIRSKLDKLIGDAVYAEPINVLLLGVKNDGSEDCSDIINEATQTHELYFPKGIYRVDNPIYVEKSIYGAGASRDYRGRNSSAPIAGTCLRSYINAVSSDNVGVLTVIKGGADIMGLSIMCNTDEDGINFQPSVEAESIKIQNVSVFSLGDAVGIKIAPALRCSRAAYIDNCTIFGKGADSTSKGMFFESTSVDSLVNNCEIMAVQVGIVNWAQIRVSNTHIWTGLLGSQTVDPWWSSTKGFDVHSELYTENAYIDTAFLSVCMHTKSQVRMHNTLIWNDNSVSASARYDQTVFYSGSEYAGQALLSVRGLTLCDRGRVANLVSSALMRHLGTSFSDVHIISDRPNEPSDAVMGMVGRIYSDDDFIESVSAGQLIEVANIAGRYGGTADIEVTVDNAKALIRYNRGNTNRFTKTAINGTVSAYYKSYNDTNGNPCYKLYIQNSGSSSQPIYVKRRCTGNATMTSYLSSTVTDWERTLPERLTSTSGLTEITS